MRRESLLFSMQSGQTFYDEVWLGHVALKFQDLSKLENVDAQIFYLT